MSSNTPRRSILRASALMASGTMVSRILGFIRNAMLIAAVGATAGGVGAAFHRHRRSHAGQAQPDDQRGR